MDARKLMVPGLVFFAGALFGRLFGVKPLVRGALTAATMAGMIPEPERASTAPAHRTTRRRVRRS